MSNNPTIRKMNSIVSKAETRVSFLFIYAFALTYVFLKFGALAVLEAYLATVIILSIIQFGKTFIDLLFFPIGIIFTVFVYYNAKIFLKQFPKNTTAEVAIILGRSSWYTFDAWVKPNYFRFELKALTNYLKKKKQIFAFHDHATIEDVKTIMRDSKIKEIYFVGHGDSHSFCLNSDELLDYCEFKNENYSKDYVHQIHCGTKQGRPLIDFVVPEENRAKCFFFRKGINGPFIVKEFKRRSKELEVNSNLG